MLINVLSLAVQNKQKITNIPQVLVM